MCRDQLVNVVSLATHLVCCETFTALGTLYFRVEPVQDALVVESVTHVAWQGRHCVTVAKVRHADRAAFDIWEAILIIGYFRCVANNTFSVDLLFVFLSPRDDTVVADAR